MSHCPEYARLQDWLDGELPAAEAARFASHLASCRECAAEAALYRRLIQTLERAPLAEPRHELTGRILARVLPSKVRRRRRLAVLGWTYAGSLLGCLLAAGVWALQPGRGVTIEGLSAAVSHRLVGMGLFVLNALGSSLLRLVDGWGLVHAVGARLAPLGRALGAVLSQPSIGFTLWAAAAACAVLLWWMRPRKPVPVKGVRHVGVLGF